MAPRLLRTDHTRLEYHWRVYIARDRAARDDSHGWAPGIARDTRPEYLSSDGPWSVGKPVAALAGHATTAERFPIGAQPPHHDPQRSRAGSDHTGQHRLSLPILKVSSPMEYSKPQNRLRQLLLRPARQTIYWDHRPMSTYPGLAETGPCGIFCLCPVGSPNGGSY